jgi:hypothetical protein
VLWQADHKGGAFSEGATQSYLSTIDIHWIWSAGKIPGIAAITLSKVLPHF